MGKINQKEIIIQKHRQSTANIKTQAHLTARKGNLAEQGWVRSTREEEGGEGRRGGEKKEEEKEKKAGYKDRRLTLHSSSSSSSSCDPSA